MSESHDDVQCMKRLADGDSSALSPLIARYQHRVLAVAYRYLSNWADSEDVTQEVFLRVLRSADRYEPSASMMTWLYRITANLCLDFQRKRSRRPESSLPDTPTMAGRSDLPDDHLQAQETAQRIALALANLPERQRMAMILLRYEGLSYRQIADAMQITPRAVDSLVSRAMSSLRQVLADMTYN